MAVIHSRAWTFECQIMAGFVPLPEDPKILMPVMSLPSRDVPAVTIFELLGYAATRSDRNVRWSAYE